MAGCLARVFVEIPERFFYLFPYLGWHFPESKFIGLMLFEHICIVQEYEFFSNGGLPKNPFPNGWKGKAGLYAVGFTRRGLSGASLDAISVANDIAKSWKEETKQRKISIASRHRRCISHF